MKQNNIHQKFCTETNKNVLRDAICIVGTFTILNFVPK